MYTEFLVLLLMQKIYFSNAHSSKVVVIHTEKALCLRAHNYLRKLHGAPALEWDDWLAVKAQEWVLHLSQIGYIKHSPTDNSFRENIHQFYSGSKKYNVLTSIRSWYATIKDYNFEKGTITNSNRYALLFANMIWDDTKKIGCAISRNKKTGEGFVVVMYSPGVHGSSPSDYRQHVHPPKEYSRNSIINSKDIYIPTIAEIRSKMTEK